MYKPTEFMHTDEDGTTVHAVRDTGGDYHLSVWVDGRDDRPTVVTTLPAEQVKQLARLAVAS